MKGLWEKVIFADLYKADIYENHEHLQHSLLGLQQICPVAVKWQSRPITPQKAKFFLWLEDITGVPLTANSSKKSLRKLRKKCLNGASWLK